MATPYVANGVVVTVDDVAIGDVATGVLATGDPATGDVVENVNGTKALGGSIPDDSVGNDNSCSLLVYDELVTKEGDNNTAVAATQTGDAATGDAATWRPQATLSSDGVE